MTHDLIIRGGELADGTGAYRATVLAGEVTRRDGADTGARPGRLLR